MIARLGDFLRLTLDHADHELVTLKEETEFLCAYLDIEQVRFGDRLKVAFEMEPMTLSAQVPHLILQPIVENAIQHAVAPRTAQSHIDIKAQRLDGLLRLEVKDNGPGIASKSDLLEPRGVGLNKCSRPPQSGLRFRFSVRTHQWLGRRPNCDNGNSVPM